MPGDVCPKHGIRCHLSGKNATYSYQDVRRNIIASPDLFANRIVGHPFKYESHRLGSENSEDALTWNVFRSLQEAGQLAEVARWITGQDIDTEPYLFLWGIQITDNSFRPWDLLIEARERFETNLPVTRPLTEPDIGLFLPGHYLVLIEAKYTSPNTYYTDGPRRDERSLTKQELLSLYLDPALRILNVEAAREVERVYYQLWRNTVFAEWMSREARDDTRAYHASLTRATTESEACSMFRQVIRPEFQDRFTQVNWEDIFHLVDDNGKSGRVKRYLSTKTASLERGLFMHRQ
jgi:hypothetical protein